jgi:hypothetical protein
LIFSLFLFCSSLNSRGHAEIGINFVTWAAARRDERLEEDGPLIDVVTSIAHLDSDLSSGMLIILLAYACASAEQSEIHYPRAPAPRPVDGLLRELPSLSHNWM